MASVIDLTSHFGNTRTANCMGLILSLFTANKQKHTPLGHPTQLVMHWTAGNYQQVWDDYHFNIAYDPVAKRACVAKTLNLTQKGQHLWKRNTGAIGVTFSGMLDKRFPITTEQIEAAGELLAEICLKYNWTEEKITDHATWAKIDGYFPTRWDIGNILPMVRAETKKVLAELKSGRRKPVFWNLLR